MGPAADVRPRAGCILSLSGRRSGSQPGRTGRGPGDSRRRCGHRRPRRPVAGHHQRTRRAVSHPGPRPIRRAPASVGFVAGLVLGGILVQLFNWRAVLWVNVPIGLAAGAARAPLVPAPTQTSVRRRLDVTGALLVTGAAALAVYAISQAPGSGWVSDQTVGALLVAFLGLPAAFVIVERRHPAPLVRFSIFRLRPLRTANLFTVLIGARGRPDRFSSPPSTSNSCCTTRLF